MAGWEDAPLASAATPAPAWQAAPILEARKQPRTAVGVLEAIEAGWQGSIPGLVDRKALPDIVLDQHHSKWYEKAAAGASQMINELPEMFVGAIAGSVMGAPAGPIGVVAGGGAGGFGIPAAIRTSLIESYKSGTVDSSGGFLQSAKIVIQQTAKESAVGALTTLAGMGAGRLVGSAIAPSIGTAITTKTAERTIGFAGTTAEVGTMVVAPAALEGRLPEWDEFLNAAILVGGLKASVGMASKIGDIYAKTGVPPEQVAAMAKQDPTIKADLMASDYSQSQVRSVSPDVKPGLGGVSEPVRAELTTSKGFDFVMEREFRGKYQMLTPEGERMGAVLFSPRADGVNWGASVAVEPGFQRRGVASAAYDFIEQQIIKRPLEQGGGQSEAGAAFRAARAERQAGAEGIPRAFQEAANQESARNAILLPDQARAFVEKPFAEVPQQPGTPKVKLNVNYDYINTPAEAQAALARASELYGPQIIEQTRGKVSWEATERDAAKSLAEMAGAKDFSLLLPREPGTASSATELLMRRQILEGATEDFTARARAYDPARSTPEQAIQMMAAAERVAMLSAQFQGAASEAGRALNILKDARQSARSAEEVTNLLKTYDRDPATIARIMQEIDNPVAAARAAREIVKASPWDKTAEALKAVMLSGPVTWGANIVGNATFLPLRPVIDAVSVPVGLSRKLLSGKEVERVRAAEPIARVVGNWQGAVDAFMAAGSFMRIYAGKPMEGLRQLDQMGARKAEVQNRAIEGDLGVLARSPFLALSVPDRLFRMMIERGEINAIAARQAAKDGHNPLSREFREKMAEYRQNLTPEQLKEVEAIGDRGTFNADLGPLGKSVMDTLDKAGPLGFLIAPFRRTPLNLLKETLRLTPASPLIDTWRADLRAGGARADKALAEVVVGGIAASITIGLAMSGKISGAGDPDPNKQRAKLAAGEQPYSFQTDDGKWYEYSRLQPLGTLIGLAADFSQIWDKFESPEESDKVVKMIGVAFANAITNQTMLMGLTNLIRAISEPDRNAERYVQGIVAMPIPGALSQTAALQDDYVREIHTIMDAVKNKIPGDAGRESLQPKIDIWGDPIQNRERVGGVGPVRTLEESTDPVKTEAARLGVSVPKTTDKIILPGGKGLKTAEIELTPEQQTSYAVIAGKAAYAAMQDHVNSTSWAQLPDLQQKKIYERAFEIGRTQARAMVIEPAQREMQYERLRQEAAAKLAPRSK